MNGRRAKMIRKLAAEQATAVFNAAHGEEIMEAKLNGDVGKLWARFAAGVTRVVKKFQVKHEVEKMREDAPVHVRESFLSGPPRRCYQRLKRYWKRGEFGRVPFVDFAVLSTARNGVFCEQVRAGKV